VENQNKHKIGDVLYSHITERMFQVEKLYDDGGILFKSIDRDNHKFKLMPKQFLIFQTVDSSDLHDGGFSF
jgi:hypothetical protein